MGCWNGSCQISGLSIPAGQKIVMIPLVRTDYGSYVPCFLPFFGEYNDYGSVKNVERNIITNMIEKTLVEFGTDIEEIFHSDKHHKIKYSYEKNGNLSYTMISREVYDWIVSSFDIYKDWMTDEFNKNLETWKSDFVSSSDTMVERILEYDQWISKINDFDFLRMFKKEGEDDKKIFADDFVDFVKFLIIFGRLRKSWSPQAQAGSQDENYKLVRGLNSFVNKISSKYEKSFEE